MINKIFFFLTVCLFLFCSKDSVAQEVFSDDNQSFVRELTRMLNQTRRDESRNQASLLEENIKDDKLSNAYLDLMRKTGNIMLSRNMRAHPHFENYVMAVNDFVATNRNLQTFEVWSDLLNNVLENQRRGNNQNFDRYIDFSISYFRNGSLHQSRARTWQVIGRESRWENTEEGPVLHFENISILAYTTGDTIEIRNVSGIFNPVEQQFQANGGRIDWSRAGYGANDVYAELTEYQFAVNSSEFSVDTVMFYYNEILSEPLQGSFSDRLITQNRPETTNYPRFESFRKDIRLDNITENVSFLGGITKAGQRLTGSGDDYNRAYLEFTREDGKILARSYSRNVLIGRRNELTSSAAEISVYLGDNDSIFHPNVRLVYKFDIKELGLYRGMGDGTSKTTFFNSFHNHEMAADVIYWRLDKDEMQVRMLTGAGQNPAVITSSNFFRRGELQRMQGVMDFNPVSVIKMYSDELGSREMYAPDLAKKMNPRYTENTIQGLLYTLVEEGFIYYNEENSVVTVRDKTINYVLANANRIDFDHIRFNSYHTRQNAKLDFETNDLLVSGVEDVTLSERRFVFVYPNDREITLKENMDMSFSGSILAGRIDFIGFGFYFDYDSFRVDMQDLASAVIYAPTEDLDEYGQPKTVPLRSRIEGLTGRLFVDAPNNKSGRVNLPQFPIFVNNAKAFVYYDLDEVHEARYDRESFYFELEPFRFDSLNTFDPYFSSLKGRMISADIFPVFEENIYIQDDLSLGFIRTTPANGFPVYGGKATFFDTISLSNRGLLGSGNIDYLFTKFDSDHILFLPDSLATIAQNFHMAESVHQGNTFPEVRGEGVQIGWRPYDDEMDLNSGTDPFVMYDIEASMSGSLVFTPQGLKGIGSFDWQEAELLSSGFNFESDALFADTIDMRIKAIDEDKVTFNTPNVKGRIDFGDRIGNFESNLLDIPTEFANNFYRTEINQFTWDMENSVLDFRAPDGSPGSPFVSTHADKDSLEFLGKRALFDLPSSLLTVEDVPYIPVANAHIIPDGNVVVIEGGGVMRELENATFKADTGDIAHEFYEATLQINGKKDFSGEGKFDFLNRSRGVNTIRMHNIFVEEIPGRRRQQPDYFTRSEGIVEAADTFRLDPKIQFQGEVKLKSEVKNLNFDGFARLDFKNQEIETNWFAFETEIDANDVIIPYETAISPFGDTLYSGLFFDRSLNPGPYVSLFNQVRMPDDKKIMTTSGIVRYSQQNSSFYIGSKEKYKDNSPAGNMIIVNEANNVIRGEGKFDMNLDFEPIKITTAGNFEKNLSDSSFVFNTIFALNLEVDDDLMEMFANDLISFVFDKPSVDYHKESFVNAYNELVDSRRGSRALEEAQQTGRFDKPRDLDYNLIFNDLTFEYIPKYQTYKSKGPIGIGFVGDKGVHKMVDGFIEFGFRRVGDFFNMYFELGPDDWYFITYNNYTLQIISSRDDFNKLLASIRPDRRERKISDEITYFYTTSTFNTMQSFVYRMKFGDEVDLPPQE
ncbi:MAG: hypothetical protein EA412_04215 [Chitinophagaceae bacterium]|nr:MAG: hypothetical protein EA412_04215 [Chitinophagaceae bacterium]